MANAQSLHGSSQMSNAPAKDIFYKDVAIIRYHPSSASENDEAPAPSANAGAKQRAQAEAAARAGALK